MRRGIIILLIAFLAVWPLVRLQAQETEGEDGRSDAVEQERENEDRIIPAPVVPLSPAGIVQPDNSNATSDPTMSNLSQSLEEDTSTSDTLPDSTVSTPSPQQPTVAKPSSWPWYFARALGIASFLLLFLLAVTGMLQTTGLIYRVMSPAAAWSFHRTVGVFLIFSILIHLSALLFDRFIDLRFADVLVPFVSPYRPLLLALGIGGFYLFIPVILTSLVWVETRPKFWRTVHFLNFPMFVAIFFHGILLGTDAKQPWMQIMYWGTGTIIGALVIYRLAWKWHPRRSIAT